MQPHLLINYITPFTRGAILISTKNIIINISSEDSPSPPPKDKGNNYSKELETTFPTFNPQTSTPALKISKKPPSFSLRTI